jgi:hypothetical protein
MEQDIATRETSDLISSSRVEGTAVYNRQGERLGSISKFMVGKRSGKVEYAVMSFGGFLGMGQDHYPLPWDMLDYDPAQGGYVVDVDKDRLQSAPRYGQNEEPQYDREYGERVSGYYGVPYPY